MLQKATFIPWQNQEMRKMSLVLHTTPQEHNLLDLIQQQAAVQAEYPSSFC